MENLIDYIADGSSVAKLMFDLGVIRILKRRNASLHAILMAEADAQAHAEQVRNRVFGQASLALRRER